MEMQALFDIFKSELAKKSEKNWKKTGTFSDLLAFSVRALSFLGRATIGKLIVTA